MDFLIARSGRVDRCQLVEEVDFKAITLSTCKEGVEKLSNQWYCLGAVSLSEPSILVQEVLEDYDASLILVRQRLTIKFFDLLHAARQGKIQISTLHEDDDGFRFRTVDITGVNK